MSSNVASSGASAAHVHVHRTVTNGSQRHMSQAASASGLPPALSVPTQEEVSAQQSAALQADVASLMVPMSAPAVMVLELKPKRPVFPADATAEDRRRGLNKVSMNTHYQRVIAASGLSREQINACRAFVVKIVKRYICLCCMLFFHKNTYNFFLLLFCIYIYIYIYII
jgi:hypothetical protein